MLANMEAKAEGLQTAVVNEVPAAAPEEWTEAGVVEAIYVYPVKSMRPCAVDEAEATPRGLRAADCRDREFIVTDANNKYVTGRRYPKMVTMPATVSRSGDKKTLKIACPSSDFEEDLLVKLPERGGDKDESLKVCLEWQSLRLL